jgi:NAD(P)-dependent dehydrogenase (short-subunit alcohol dehydrogenase family)
MTDLTGKTALVTGSTDGVGRMVATRLGAMGARILSTCIDADPRCAASAFVSLAWTGW